MIDLTMSLSKVDWMILVVYILLTLGLGIFLRKRASRGIENYFLAGRSFPWWLTGTSLVATTFSNETVLAVTGLVAKEGIAGNWFWWVQCLSTMTVCFFFARWWRRSMVLTDVEFVELRYSDRPGSFLRGFSSLYRGLILATMKTAFIIMAMTKICDAFFGEYKHYIVITGLVVVALYSIFSGFWGVVLTDFIQFAMAMIGTTIFAFIALHHVGGVEVLHTKLVTTLGAAKSADMLSFFPSWNSVLMPPIVILTYLGVMWWADARVEGGAYVAQRLMASKNERHATFSALWFNIAHYALRPWPWIIVALVSVVVYPDLQDKEMGYPMLMKEWLPIGLKGLVLASFFAAFMSTVDTLVNWGTSYLVNDFYKRFIVNDGSKKHYVIASKVCEFSMLIGAYFLSKHLHSVVTMWKLIASLTIGLGVVYIGRWFWWRVNAWSEVTAMIASGVGTFVLTTYTDWPFVQRILVIVPISLVSWITVTYLTKPVSMDQLITFYKRVRPYPMFWKPVVKAINDPAYEKSPDNFAKNARCWVYGIVVVYSALATIGKWILGTTTEAVVATLLCIASSLLLWRELREPSKDINEDEGPAVETEVEAEPA